MSETRIDHRRALARLAVETGLGIGDGAMLLILGEPPHRDLMNTMAEVAYDRGARLVRVEYDDRRLLRTRVDRAREAHVDAVSAMTERDAEIYVEEGWSFLRLDGYEDATALEGADPDRLTRLIRAQRRATTVLRKAQLSSRIAWCVVPAATSAWAQAVFGLGATVDRLWETLVPILRLDAADPPAVLRAHMEALEERGRMLTGLGLRSLGFTGPGTDLRVALSPDALWQGGADRTPQGRPFMPNLPTEETFTTPDFRGTEGHLTTTRPTRIHGALVDGARIEFRAGQVVSTSAAKGAGMLEHYVKTDPGAGRLGEVALVDVSSPIWKAGLVFDSILLDENAACHVALGASYDPAVRGAVGWSDQEKESRGVNVSQVHQDFMIGSEEMDVTGLDAAGREIPVIRRGRFAL